MEMQRYDILQVKWPGSARFLDFATLRDLSDFSLARSIVRTGVDSDGNVGEFRVVRGGTGEIVLVNTTTAAETQTETLDSLPYGVWDNIERRWVYRTTYKNRVRARRWADRKDLEYGAIRYSPGIIRE